MTLKPPSTDFGKKIGLYYNLSFDDKKKYSTVGEYNLTPLRPRQFE